MWLRHISGLCSETQENLFKLFDDWENWKQDPKWPDDPFDVYGWKLNIDSGSGFINATINNKKCSISDEKEHFFGYMKGEANGGVETILKGSGKLQIKFGNCGDKGISSGKVISCRNRFCEY